MRVKTIVPSSLIAGGGVLTVVHIYVAGKGLGYTGPLLLVDHLFDLALVLTLVALGTALGQFILSRAGLEVDDPVQCLLIGLVLGLGALATAILLLGLLSGLHAWTLLLLLLGGALLSRRELRRLPSDLHQVINFVRLTGGSRWELVFGVSVLAVAATVLVVLSTAPPVDWDTLMYHVQAPSQFLEAGRVYLPEDNLHVSFVGLVHMLYLPLLAFESASGPALLSAVLAVMLGLAVFSFSARFFDGSTASISLAAVWATGSVLLVAITPRVDVTLALFLFMAHYTLVRALSEEGVRKSHLILTAVLFGLAFGVKYQALPYILALGPFVLWAAWKEANELAGTVRFLAVLAMVSFIAAAPWLLKNLLLLGAPLYPFLADRLLEPWLADLYGTSAFPSSISPETLGALGSVRESFNLFDALFAPGKITVEAEGEFYGASPLFLLLIFWPLVWRERVINYLILPAIGYLLIVILPFGITNLRYLIPAAVPLSVAAAYILVRGCRRLLPQRAAFVAMIVVTALALIPSGGTAYIWVSRTESLGYLAGATSASEYMKSHIDPTVSWYGLLTEFINESVPPEARMLMLFDARGYYIERHVLQDNSLTNWPLIAPYLSEDSCLRAVGASHLILALGSLGFYLNRGIDPDAIRLSELERFARRCLEPIYDGPGFIVFRTR